LNDFAWIINTLNATPISANRL